MKPEQLEIEKLCRELAKLKAERDILKSPQPTFLGTRYEVRVYYEARCDLAGGMTVQNMRSLLFRLSRLVQSFSK